jgi:hypothetical protein
LAKARVRCMAMWKPAEPCCGMERRFNRSLQLVYLAVDITLRNCHHLGIDIRSFKMPRFKSAGNIVSTLSPKPVFF